MASWDEFERRQAEQTVTEKPNPDRDRFFELCATVFSTGSGAELLQELRRITIERRTPIGASEAVLREIEATRHFVSDLVRARDRGLKVLADRGKPKP